MNQLLTCEQAAEQLAMTPAALAQLRYRGTGPVFVRMGSRAIRYARADLTHWISGNRWERTDRMAS